MFLIEKIIKLTCVKVFASWGAYNYSSERAMAAQTEAALKRCGEHDEYGFENAKDCED